MTRAPVARCALLCSLVAAAAGCNPLFMATRTNSIGWFSVRLDPGLEYADRFDPVPLSLNSPPCVELQPSSSTIYVFVPGFVGDNDEWHRVVDTLSSNDRAYMLRWVPYDERDLLVGKVAAGLTRLLACTPQTTRVVVLGHSAGGVLVAQSLAGVAGARAADGHPRVLAVTAASALAGSMNRPGAPDGSEDANYVFDLGTRIVTYPAAADGVQVVHLNTTAESDFHMKPDGDFKPNDPRRHVPRAHLIVLPGADHRAALYLAADALAGNGWRAWLATPPAP